MNQTESLTKLNPRLNRIEKVSRILKRIFFLGGLAFTGWAIFLLYVWLWRRGSHSIELIYGLQSLSSFGYAMEFWLGYKLFAAYARGNLFAPPIARWTWWIGGIVLLTGAWGIGIEVFRTVRLGVSTEMIWWGSLLLGVFIQFMLGVVPGFVIIFTAWIMDEGRKIQEEQGLTV